jgi:hypothetical protein
MLVTTAGVAGDARDLIETAKAFADVTPDGEAYDAIMDSFGRAVARARTAKAGPSGTRSPATPQGPQRGPGNPRRVSQGAAARGQQACPRLCRTTGCGRVRTSGGSKDAGSWSGGRHLDHTICTAVAPEAVLPGPHIRYRGTLRPSI